VPAAVLSLASVAPAQEGRSGGEPWVVRFEPTAWYAAPNGTVRLPGSGSSGNGESFEIAGLNLDSPRFTPLGELQVGRGRWRARVMGTWFDSSDRGVEAGAGGQIGDAVFSPGDTLRSSLEMSTLAADGGYVVYRYESEPGAVDVDSSVALLGGVRALDVSMRTEVVSGGSVSGEASGDALHAHPYVGVRWQLELARDFAIDLTTSLGGLSFGDSESWSSDILVGFHWQPTPYLGVQAGYRQLLLGIETDEAPTEFAWQGGLAGVFAGATLRF
jgi:hypothetical protein